MVEGRFGPAAAADGALAVGGALAVVVFLSEVEVVVMVVEDAGRLVGAGTEPPAAAVLGRDLEAALGLADPAAGCNAGPRHTGAMEGKIKRESKGKKQIRKMDDNDGEV